MRSMTTSGWICLEDDYHFIYRVGRIDYTEWENGEFEYIFSPNYAVIDMLPDNLFQGIPGIDLSLRRATYERRNQVPVFIAERTPSPNREDVRILLEENGMNALNRLEWLIKTNKRYSGDRFFIMPIENGPQTMRYTSMFDLAFGRDALIRRLLVIICLGDYLITREIEINDANRETFYRFLMPLYVDGYERNKRARMRGIEEAKARSAYRGRTQIAVDPLLFDKYKLAFLQGQISAAEAAERLGISRATFFRRMKNGI